MKFLKIQSLYNNIDLTFNKKITILSNSEVELFFKILQDLEKIINLEDKLDNLFSFMNYLNSKSPFTIFLEFEKEDSLEIILKPGDSSIIFQATFSAMNYSINKLEKVTFFSISEFDAAVGIYGKKTLVGKIVDKVRNISLYQFSSQISPFFKTSESNFYSNSDKFPAWIFSKALEYQDILILFTQKMKEFIPDFCCMRFLKLSSLCKVMELKFEGSNKIPHYIRFDNLSVRVRHLFILVSLLLFSLDTLILSYPETFLTNSDIDKLIELIKAREKQTIIFTNNEKFMNLD